LKPQRPTTSPPSTISQWLRQPVRRRVAVRSRRSEMTNLSSTPPGASVNPSGARRSPSSHAKWSSVASWSRKSAISSSGPFRVNRCTTAGRLSVGPRSRGRSAVVRTPPCSTILTPGNHVRFRGIESSARAADMRREAAPSGGNARPLSGAAESPSYDLLGSGAVA